VSISAPVCREVQSYIRWAVELSRFSPEEVQVMTLHPGQVLWLGQDRMVVPREGARDWPRVTSCWSRARSVRRLGIKLSRKTGRDPTEHCSRGQLFMMKAIAAVSASSDSSRNRCVRGGEGRDARRRVLESTNTHCRCRPALGPHIHPEKAADEYCERVIAPYRTLWTESRLAELREQLAGACTVEIAAFDEFTELLAGDQRHSITFCSPPLPPGTPCDSSVCRAHGPAFWGRLPRGLRVWGRMRD
jgi:hypothetical protein